MYKDRFKRQCKKKQEKVLSANTYLFDVWLTTAVTCKLRDTYIYIYIIYICEIFIEIVGLE